MPKRRSKPSRGSAPLPERWAHLKPTLVAFAWTATLIGAALALGMGVPVLRADALKRAPEGSITVTFSDRPVWMTDGEIGPIADLVAEQIAGSPMDRHGLERARGHGEGHEGEGTEARAHRPSLHALGFAVRAGVAPPRLTPRR